jgi:uncharacterized protein
MSALSLFRSHRSEQATTSKSTIWRAIKAGKLPAARAVGLKELLAALLREDYATACALAAPLADHGLAAAQLILGAMHGGGLGVPRNDGEAAKWRHLAADQGLAEAQTILGVMYAKGEGVAQNDAAAAKWFHKAAGQGLAEAQTILGAIYVKGQGVAQSYVLAHMWFNLAAAQGDAAALANRDQLARMMTPAQIAEAQHLAQEWKPTR